MTRDEYEQSRRDIIGEYEHRARGLEETGFFEDAEIVRKWMRYELESLAGYYREHGGEQPAG